MVFDDDTLGITDASAEEASGGSSFWEEDSSVFDIGDLGNLLDLGTDVADSVFGWLGDPDESDYYVSGPGPTPSPASMTPAIDWTSVLLWGTGLMAVGAIIYLIARRR